MRWSTHRAIARAAARMIGLGGGELSSLLRGVVDPDRNPERTVKVKVGRGSRVYTRAVPVSHHNPSIGMIMRHVWRARRSLLAGDAESAAYWAGWAVHYVQDKCAGKGPLGLRHGPVEEGAAHVPIDEDLVRRGVRGAACSPNFVRRVIGAVKPSTSPVRAVEEAVLASSAILAAIFGPTRPPPRLMAEYREAAKRHGKILIGIAGSLMAALASAAVNLPPLILFSAAAAGGLYLADGRYRELRDEAGWFGEA